MASKKRVGVILCGCGHRDGSEVHEATLALLALANAGAEAACFAPTGPQRFVRDHVSGADVSAERDCLAESARIARGRIRDLAEARADELDALVIPGGQGAALNLSSYLAEGTAGRVHPELERLVGEMVAAQKPIGAICIAPAMLAMLLAKRGVKATLTAGFDEKVAADIEGLGHRHATCPPTACIVDRENRIVTTPAYMEAAWIDEVWPGIEKLVHALLEMA